MKQIGLISTLLALSLCANTASGEDLSLSETSYVGASILQGDWEVTLGDTIDVNLDEDNLQYSFFEGNTLYVGNSDAYGNSIDGIVEFFWFQSSIDRGADFYVAVIKARTSPGDDCYWAPWLSGYDCHLWADEYQDFGEYPVLSVEAFTDVSREAGAFRWDWSVPFENYGIDAYGQISMSNQYGIGSTTQTGMEGAVMSALNVPDGTNINGIPVNGGAEASASIQSKGYISSDYKVQTQYDVTLYEWDIFVDGRANLMAWDMYLNLGVRDDQSAYHEYFLAIQVEEGQPFMLDELNILGNFDTGWWNPFRSELGLSVKNIQIHQPIWEETSEEVEEETTFDTGLEEEIEEEIQEEIDENDTGSRDQIELEDSEKVVSGCSTGVNQKSNLLYSLFAVVLLASRRKQ